MKPLLGLVLGLVVCFFVVSSVLVVVAATVVSQGTGGTPGQPMSPISCLGGTCNPVVTMAVQMAAHLHCQPPTIPSSSLDCADPRLPVPLDTWYDAGFPAAVLHWAQVHCAGCPSWQNGLFQCVPFVIASYAFFDPLPVQGQNANQYWQTLAFLPGWKPIAATETPGPGDILQMDGGPFGHVAIILSATTREITFAQADAQAPIQTLPRSSDGTVTTQNGYWNHFTVHGYLHDRALDRIVANPKNQYVQLARQDALRAGINPEVFVRQIDVESGFNPNAVSPAGAIGIAQFLPSTAAGLGIDPWNPVASLQGAASYMATLTRQYGGESAKALAAYNAGPGAVQYAMAVGGANWRNDLPAETQAYLQAILG